MSRRIASILVVGIVALAVGASSWARDDRDETSLSPSIATNAVVTGRNLPRVALVALDGGRVSTSDLADGPLILNFWYSTCEPCRREMPALQHVHESLGDRISLVGVNIADSATVARNFAARHGVTFPIVRDPDARLTSAVGIGGAPTTLFVDADGRIVEQVAGELTVERIEAIVRERFPG